MELAIVFIVLTAASEIIALTPLKSNSIVQLILQVIDTITKSNVKESK